MTNLTYQQLEDLKQAFNEATPGVWFRLHDTPPDYQADDVEDKVQPDGSQLFLAQPTKKMCNCAQVWSLEADFPVAYCAVRSAYEVLDPITDKHKLQQMADAKLIGMMKTYFPALIAEVENRRAADEDAAYNARTRD